MFFSNLIYNKKSYMEKTNFILNMLIDLCCYPAVQWTPSQLCAHALLLTLSTGFAQKKFSHVTFLNILKNIAKKKRVNK